MIKDGPRDFRSGNAVYTWEFDGEDFDDDLEVDFSRQQLTLRNRGDLGNYLLAMKLFSRCPVFSPVN